MTDEENRQSEGPKIRRRDRILLFLIAAIAIGTFIFAILQFVAMKREP